MHVEISSFTKNTWIQLSMKMRRARAECQELGLQAVFLKKLLENKGKTMQKQTRICSSHSSHSTMFIFSMLYIISTTIDSMIQL